MLPNRKNSNRSRRPHQRKKALTGHKSLRGVPEIYETVKERFYARLTEQSSDGITALSEQFSLSRSELLEQVGRQIITVKITARAIKQGNQEEAGTQTPCCFALTVTGVQGLDELANQAGITRREFIAQLGLGNIQIVSKKNLL
jgi:hypothetical protein